MKALDQLVDSLMYEGYLLYPYRKSSIKNQKHQFMFGRIEPGGMMQTECLAHKAAGLHVEVRFVLPETAEERRIIAGEEFPEGHMEVSSQDEKITVKIFANVLIASVHTILQIEAGDFISATEAGDRCKNIGTWPVLVGDGRTMLSSPIILQDYPQIAPESAGNLFDATEIDEILSLRILTLTDEEKAEVRQNERGRRLLERTESLTLEDFLKMHGAQRGVPADVHKGDRVRIRPKSRADAMDIILDGKTAVVEAVEQDAEGKFHLALVLDDDPGKDLGMMRQPGHRFFYGLEEVEPV